MGGGLGQTALADAGVEDFGEDLVVAGDGDGVVVDDLDGAALCADEGDALGGPLRGLGRRGGCHAWACYSSGECGLWMMIGLRVLLQ